MLQKMEFLFLFISILIFLIGCNKSAEEGEALPITNLTIVADTEGDGVIVSWDEIQDIIGYIVITPDGDSISLEWSQNSYHDDNPLSTGVYIVYSYNSSDTGDTSLISNSPFAGPTEVTLYVWSHSTLPFGFLFDTLNWVNQYVFDFYLNDNTAVFDFTSCDEPPYNGDRTCHILNMGNQDFLIAPTAGYYNTEPALEDTYYAFSLQGDYYGKVYVVSTTDSTATFIFWYQTIQSLRLF